MKKKILNTIWVMGVLALAGFCLSACDNELDIQQAYPFTVETMPVQKHIAKGLFKQNSEKVNLMPIDILLKENLKYYLNNKL